ncbi:acetyl-CoA carboxylase biotin carboxyl carrier protein subunit [Silvibacterium dinghuense]|nr:acetyl-CoA carboxylase biotin carboxyl carrier protein subunit [Silvibacterium dinghuense]GGH03085.1 acetyl-CoA carboxylase biotin carboxyl carrier protein subunit [Silvibacterium dinghuense]
MKLEMEIDGKQRRVVLEPGEKAGQWQCEIDGRAYAVEAQPAEAGVLSLLIDGRSYRAALEENGDETAVHLDGRRYEYRLDDPRSLKARRRRGVDHDGPKPIHASMPGRVVRVLAQKGDAVEAGQGVVVIEAMKMQNELKAPRAGTLSELSVAPGDTVAAGEVLAVIA